MARIPDEVVNRLKTEVSLLRLVEASGVELKKQGKDWLGCCPFHNDKTPSLVVSPESNLWHCLGACNAGGSVIDWVMKTQGVAFRHACELLLHAPDAAAQMTKGVVVKASTPKLPCPLDADKNDAELMQQVVTYYHTTLLESPEALAYLEKRGLRSVELIEAFQLGYANRSLGYRLPEKNRKAGAELRGKLQGLGILRDSGHEHFNGSLVVPVQDELGQVVEIYGRKINDNLREGTAYHLYLPGPHAGVWNAAGLQGQTEVILCESLMDAMTFWVHGFKNVTSSYGVNGFTAEHLAVFKQLGLQRILIAYDRDEAGEKAAFSLAAELQSEGFDCYRVLFPKGMDVNEYALKMSPPRKALEVLIRKAEWLGTGQPAAALKSTLDTIKIESNHSPVEPEIEPAALSLVAETAFNLAAKEKETAASALNQIAEVELPASPMPTQVLPAATDLRCEINENELVIILGERRYRVRGLNKNTAPDQLKINLMVSNERGFHTDTLELYNAKQRQVFVNQACVELGVKDEVIKTDLGKVLLKLEQVQDHQKQAEKAAVSPLKALSSEEQNDALNLLKDKELLTRILADFTSAGVVGEETNKLVGYLACVSRKLEKPLAVMIQSTSAAGKSSLMEAILAFMPEEERVQYSAMTGQSLFYMGEKDLKHKILAIAEEEGAHHASYALKLLQSEGEVTIASTGKDDATGNLITKEYKVEGPTQLFMTTTAIDLDEELLNRCLVLSVDEGREQTRAIHQAQRQKRTLAGLQAKLEQERVIQLHRNAQRLIRPLAIINPYADQLTFLDDKTRTRRDHEKYLTLIDAIALLHQQQRDIKRIQSHGKTLEYIEVQLSDIEAANRLAHEVLGRTLDELPPQTRKLLKLIQGMVKSQCQEKSIDQRDYRFSRKTIRDTTGWGNTQLKIHCKRLEEMEYLLIHRGGRGQSLEYELLFDGQNEQDRHLMGLIEAKQLATTLNYDGQRSGLSKTKSAPSRGEVGGVSTLKNGPNATADKANAEIEADEDENTSGAVKNTASYRSHSAKAASSLVAASAVLAAERAP